MFAATISTNGIVWFFYYLTFWGFVMTFVSIVASTKAVHYPEWVKFAYYSTEMAHTCNLIIVPLFWIFLAPAIFPQLSWKGHDLFERVHMTTLHSVPMIGSLTNIVLTDIELQTSHYKYSFIMGVVYLFANAMGSYEAGMGLYPIVDWKNKPETAALFVVMALIQSGLYYGFAYLQNNYLPRKAK